MKILQLDLRAFGPFTDVVVDLSAGSDGLHIVYGPNEAGKTTALRAIEQALFGIPAQTSDDFLHSYKNLRVGATLAMRDGASLHFLRRKAPSNSLLAVDNMTPLPDAALRPFLEELDRDRFRTMFGIDHPQLIKGGSEIAGGTGDVGEVLFAAGSGIADLQAVQERLLAEADTLFTRRGQKPRVNEQLKALDAARKKTRHAQLAGDEWRKIEQAAGEAAQRRAAAEKELTRLRSDLARLERLERAIPLVGRRRKLVADRGQLGDVVRLPPGFADKRRAAAADLEAARNTLAHLEEERAGVDEQLAAADVPDALLSRSREIRELPEALGSYRKANRDLPGLVAKRDQAQKAAADALRQVRPDLSLDAAHTIRLSKLQQLAISDLGGRYEALLVAQRSAQQELDESNRQLAADEEECRKLEHLPDVGPLNALLRRVQAEGDLEASLAESRSACQRTAEQLAIDLARLTLWSGSIEDLVRLPLPTTETVDRFEQQMSDLDRRTSAVAQRLDELLQAQADNQQQLDELRREGEVPTEEDLAAARALRDEGWQLVAEVLQHGQPDATRAAQFVARFAPAENLAAAYQESVRAADQCADRLRRESQRVARQSGLLAQRDAYQRQHDALAHQKAALLAEQDTLHRQWREQWQPAHIEPHTPREMRAWLQNCRVLIQQAQTCDAQRATVRQVEARLADRRRQLCDQLSALGESAPAESESLLTILARCQALVERVEAARVRREQFSRSVRQLTLRRQTVQQRLDEAQAALQTWREQWALALEPLGLAADTPPGAASVVVSQISELFARLADAADKAERIEGIGRDADEFNSRVKALVEQIAPDLIGQALETSAGQLVARHDRAVGEQQRCTMLQQQRARLVAQVDEVRQRIDTLAATLKVLCDDARCTATEQLPDAERRSDEAQRVEQQIAAIDEQLLSLPGVREVDAILAEADAVAADLLPAELAQVRQQIEQLDAQRIEAAEAAAGLQTQLRALQADAGAADAAEEVQDLLAGLQTDVLEYARLRLAAAVLREGIENYRAKNEGPVLRRASELFCQFTLGRFERLIVETDSAGRQVLKGVRHDGPAARPGEPKTVDLTGMSEGTADQLFLALRLASLEHYLSNREPIPLVLDDILISFDDARAGAALSALAELSQRTQILFFTHHQHLVDIAKRTLEKSLFCLHDLR